MPLSLYNTLTRRKEAFEAIDPKRVGLYVCGPTVYDRAHIGNARAVVAFDVLYRVLRHQYGADHVRYVRNITDVEDKIIAAARENGEPIDALTRRTTAVFHEDMAALGNLPPDVEPRATEYIPQMIAMIRRLIDSDHAYPDPNGSGHVLFRVASYPKYGALSRRSRADMIAGARVEVAPYKEDPGDFVLWKPSGPDIPGWASQWGRGRPGWHIECSAMSDAELGETFDIHGGGLDLIFPHHENEIAQSVCAHDGHPFARFWLHNGMLTVGGVKMAKSEGNFITVGELLGKEPDWFRNGEILRVVLLSAHYRDPLDWTGDRLHQAQQALDRFYRALSLPQSTAGIVFSKSEASTARVREALDDDLNVPLAISHLHEIATEINSTDVASEHGQARRATLQSALKAGGNLMGLLEHDPRGWLRGGTLPGAVLVRQEQPPQPQSFVHPGVQDASAASTAAPDARRIEERIALRTDLRRQRRFAEADQVRTELFSEGILLEDRADGTTGWVRVHTLPFEPVTPPPRRRR
jgi:cysteinyl-tRNA synthetase